MRSRKSCPVPWGAAELAARQEAVDLVDRQPELWSLLDRLTQTSEHLGMRSGVNWAKTLDRLRAASQRRGGKL
jgi:hypothetical protein